MKALFNTDNDTYSYFTMYKLFGKYIFSNGIVYSDENLKQREELAQIEIFKKEYYDSLQNAPTKFFMMAQTYFSIRDAQNTSEDEILNTVLYVLQTRWSEIVADIEYTPTPTFTPADRGDTLSIYRDNPFVEIGYLAMPFEIKNWLICISLSLMNYFFSDQEKHLILQLVIDFFAKHLQFEEIYKRNDVLKKKYSEIDETNFEDIFNHVMYIRNDTEEHAHSSKRYQISDWFIPAVVCDYIFQQYYSVHEGSPKYISPVRLLGYAPTQAIFATRFGYTIKEMSILESHKVQSNLLDCCELEVSPAPIEVTDDGIVI